jgi:Asp/Glu/hydantoin racemase
MSTPDAQVRIALIHALEESIGPARMAFRELWPEAYCFDLLDTSLAVDLAHNGVLDAAMTERFQCLAEYARSSAGVGGAAAGILFTCSAFGPAIDAVKAKLSIPVLRPNQAAFDIALDRGSRLALVVSFEPSLGALEAELHAMALARGRCIDVRSVFAAGALDALKRGDGETHDRIVASAAAGMDDVDTVILGQFSLARARARVERACGIPTLTTPHSAVAALKRMIAGGRARPLSGESQGGGQPGGTTFE